MNSTPTLFAPTTTGRLAPAIVPVDPNVRACDKKRLSDQASAVLHTLRKHGQISPEYARHFGIQGLAARIKDLRAAGHNITTTRDPVSKEAIYRMEAQR